MAKSTRCASGQTGLVAQVLLQLQKKTCFFSAFFVYPFALFLSLRLHYLFVRFISATGLNNFLLSIYLFLVNLLKQVLFQTSLVTTYSTNY